MLDVDKTKIKLGNATTKLLDLNNAKFVEHTVMDMDASLSNTEKCFTNESDKVCIMTSIANIGCDGFCEFLIADIRFRNKSC